MAVSNLVNPFADEIAVPVPNVVAARSAGRRIGFLSNRKPNATVVEQELGRLAEAAGIPEQTLFYEKPSPGVGASAELLDQIAAECDVVMVGSADCGSCTSWCCHDAVELENRGLSAMVLCTAAFQPLAEMQTAALGRPNLARLEVPHPLGGSTADVAIDKARTAWPHMEAWLKQVTASIEQTV